MASTEKYKTYHILSNSEKERGVNIVAFIRPAVHVYQQYISTTASTITPFFELCIVGPSYLVVRDKYITNSSVTTNVDYNAGTAFNTAYPDFVAGSTVDSAFTKAYMKDAFLKVWPSYVQGADKLVETVTIENDERVSKVAIPTESTLSTFGAAGIKVGDIVYVKSGDKVYQSTVNSVLDPKTFYLSKNVPTPLGTTGTTFDVEVTIIRAYTDADTLALPVNPGIGAAGGATNGLVTTSADVTLADTLSVTLGSTTYRIYSGKVYVTYRALRTYLSGDFVELTSQDNADGVLGKIDIANPLAIACQKVFENASVSFKVLPIATDDTNGYIKALRLLSTSDKVYVIVPLTDNSEVVQAYASHMTAMSDPVKSKWRIMYCNLRMPATKVLVEQNDGTVKKDASDTNAYLVDTADGKFNSKGTIPGDFIDLYASADNKYLYSLMVTGVLNDSVAMTDLQKYVKGDDGYALGTEKLDAASAVNLAVKYEVCRKLSTYGIAEEMVTVAKSYSNRRVRIVEPDEVVITINNVDYTLPGYYLCAAYGALRASFPPHQGFTTLGVSGFKALRRSNKYFEDVDLDLMAGGGIFVVVQDSASSLPYCIYQTTTDLTDLKSKEDSCVATIDFASMYYRDNLRAVLGKFNVNEISENYVSSVIKDVTAKMKRMTYPYIGSVLVSGELKSMSTSTDKILPIVGIEIPYPVNEVDLYLQV